MMLRKLFLISGFGIATISLTAGAAPKTPIPHATRVPQHLEALIDDLIDATGSSAELRSARGTLEFSETQIFFEENTTDGDLGIQFKLDGEPWRRVWIFQPDGRLFANVRVGGNARVIGLTEVFSESAEPSFDELPRDEFLDLFPPGEYTMLGLLKDGGLLLGTADLTHDFPAAPVITAPMMDEEVDPDEPLIVSWNTVADPNPPDSVIIRYHVVVEKDEDDELSRVFAIDMLPGENSVTVPAEFLEPGKDYKAELIAEETSGNKTIAELEFATEED